MKILDSSGEQQVEHYFTNLFRRDLGVLPQSWYGIVYRSSNYPIRSQVIVEILDHGTLVRKFIFSMVYLWQMDCLRAALTHSKHKYRKHEHIMSLGNAQDATCFEIWLFYQKPIGALLNL